MGGLVARETLKPHPPMPETRKRRKKSSRVQKARKCDPQCGRRADRGLRRQHSKPPSRPRVPQTTATATKLLKWRSTPRARRRNSPPSVLAGRRRGEEAIEEQKMKQSAAMIPPVVPQSQHRQPHYHRYDRFLVKKHHRMLPNLLRQHSVEFRRRRRLRAEPSSSQADTKQNSRALCRKKSNFVVEEHHRTLANFFRQLFPRLRGSQTVSNIRKVVESRIRKKHPENQPRQPPPR